MFPIICELLSKTWHSISAQISPAWLAIHQFLTKQHPTTFPLWLHQQTVDRLYFNAALDMHLTPPSTIAPKSVETEGFMTFNAMTATRFQETGAVRRAKFRQIMCVSTVQTPQQVYAASMEHYLSNSTAPSKAPPATPFPSLTQYSPYSQSWSSSIIHTISYHTSLSPILQQLSLQLPMTPAVEPSTSRFPIIKAFKVNPWI